MKKILLILLIGSGLFASSCTKRYETVQPNQTLLADLKPADWKTTDAGVNFSTIINAPQINNYVNSHDGVLVYLTFDNGTTYEQIPEVYNNVSFTYTYTAGGLELFAQSSNGSQVIDPPSALSVKIVLVDSQ